jgi:hypothetical protein
VVTAELVGPALTPPPSPAGPSTVARAEIAAPTPAPAPTADRVRADTGAGEAGEVDPVEELAGDGGLVDDLGWQPAEARPTIGWAAVVAAIAVGAWALGRWWRRWPAYAVASPTFTVALLTCFAHLDRLLPAA